MLYYYSKDPFNNAADCTSNNGVWWYYEPNYKVEEECAEPTYFEHLPTDIAELGGRSKMAFMCDKLPPIRAPPIKYRHDAVILPASLETANLNPVPKISPNR